MQENTRSEKNFSSEIDDLDRQLLFLLDKNCRQSTSQLSEELGRSRQTIEYRMRRLQESGVLLGFNTTFNAAKMGFKPYKFQMKLRHIPKERERLLKHLYEMGRGYWIGQSSGTWDLLFGVFYRNKMELVEIINDISLKFPRSVVDITGHSIVEIHGFSKMYLTREISPPKMHTSAETEEISLDNLDFRILAELIQNARIPVIQLAKKIQSTPAVVKRKMQLLEEKGVTVQYRVSVDYNKLGLDFYKAVFPLKGYTAEEHDRFYAHICRIPELQFYVRNIWSIELELMVGSFEYYQSMMEDLKRAFPRMLGDYDTVLLSTDEWTPAFTHYLKNYDTQAKA